MTRKIRGDGRRWQADLNSSNRLKTQVFSVIYGAPRRVPMARLGISPFADVADIHILSAHSPGNRPCDFLSAYRTGEIPLSLCESQGL
jgi:hypothetical protein